MVKLEAKIQARLWRPFTLENSRGIEGQRSASDVTSCILATSSWQLWAEGVSEVESRERSSVGFSVTSRSHLETWNKALLERRGSTHMSGNWNQQDYCGGIHVAVMGGGNSWSVLNSWWGKWRIVVPVWCGEGERLELLVAH